LKYLETFEVLQNCGCDFGYFGLLCANKWSIIWSTNFNQMKNWI